MQQAAIVRIVVASPGDVQAERNALSTVVEELNHGIARDRGLRLELARWETDAYPGFHPEGPQGLIDAILRVEDCDILIGIFWKRFGTPVQDADSGTEHEFRLGYEAWKQTRRPHIMVYFNQRAYTPKTREETDQWGQVLDFQKNFPKEGLWWPYRGKPHFDRLVRQHLTRFIHDHMPRPADTPRARQGPHHLGPETIAALRKSYLTWLMEQVRAVPLAGIDPKSIREETRRDLDLAAVYTALTTQRTEDTIGPDPGPVPTGPGGRGEREQLSALAVANAEPRLALLGDPGSGKSTFVNFVALCMAGELLDHPDANLAALRAAVPKDDEAPRNRREVQLQPWDHGPLMPIRVILREFVARGLLPAGQAAEVTGETLWNDIVEALPPTLRDFAQPLRHELEHIGGLLLLDGLDEVPEADQRRVQVKIAVEQFATLFPHVRILVTSRTYAYQRQDWKLNHFAEAGLAPFNPAQIHAFVDRWYAHVGPARGLSANDIQGQALLLNDAIRRNPRLSELAMRPLLLTLMASLHAWRQGKLPDQREELYADAVDLLLDQWENRKLRRKPDGTYEITEPSLAEWLRVDHIAVRQTLNRLAFEAHRDQSHLVGTADITQDTLVSALMGLNPHPDPDRRPARLIEYLRDRAGILEPRGVGIYAFPHRTFQEYLAACHLTECDDFPYNIADLLRADPNRWREVTLLAGAKAVRGAVAYAWLLTDVLCPVAPSTERRADEAGYWGALLTAQVLTENRSLRSTIAERNRPRIERIQQWLVCTLRHGALSPVDRAQAGDALAVIGDPRFRADAWQLPDESLLGFVEIPAGPFRMGSDKRRDPQALDEERPQHEVRLPRYFIARYPVTVAQFRAFVEDGGYRAEDEMSLRGLPNHPVVAVTWHRALDYCTWLTERLREWAGTPEPLATLLRKDGWQVLLPSEAEWEKAARGGDGRIYPWGKEPDPNRANYANTGIDATSTVGCFPGGASAHGVEELSGNVWEWTRSLWEPAYKYPYKPNDGRENLDAADNILRVLRGGAFGSTHWHVRCACRFRSGPGARYDGFGFRGVVRPCR